MAEIRKFIVPSNPLGRTYNKQQIDQKIADIPVPDQYTDEQAQDAVGNAVGTGLDYDDTTGAISVDLTETTAIVTDPATQVRNTIQPTADVTGLTLKKYYNTPTEIQPDNLSTGTLIGWWRGDDYVSGSTWADHGPNGYNLTGYCAGTGTLNGHKTLLFNGSGYFQNTSGFTISQPYVVFAVVKANYSGTAYPGGTFVASGQSPYAMLTQYYEAENLSPGFAMYSGGGWSPIDKYGTVGLSTVVVAKYNGASSYIRSGGNVNTTGDPGSNSMTGVTIGNGYNYLAAASGAVAEVVIVTSPSDAEISGIEGYLAVKYNLELASNTQTANMFDFKTGVGDSFWRVDANGTIVPKLLAGSASALDVGVFSDSYPKWKLTPSRIEIGDGTYDVEGQTGLYQKGWEFNAPTTVNGNFGFISKSNYIDQEFQIRPPGNSLFSVNTGTYKMVLDTGLGGFIGPSAAGNVALDVRGYSGQTASLQRWTNSSATVLSHINKDGYLAIGSQSPTAYLHLKAGTATAGTAPLKLTSGTLNTTAEAGAIEFLTNDYFATITTGAARKAFVLDDGTRLTSGRIPFATTNGRLTDDADLTFATDTLTATKIVGTTSVKAGTAAGFISSDGSTGATGSFTTVDLKTVTVKDGIITSIV